MSTENTDRVMSWLSERWVFVAVALVFLVVTTARFSGDLYAFLFTLFVLLAVIVLD